MHTVTADGTDSNNTHPRLSLDLCVLLLLVGTALSIKSLVSYKSCYRCSVNLIPNVETELSQGTSK